MENPNPNPPAPNPMGNSNPAGPEKKYIQIFLAFVAILLVLALGYRGFRSAKKSDTPTPAPNGGWVTIAPNNRYLMFENGAPFMPLGISMSGDHINMDYYGTAKVDGQTVAFSDNHFEQLFQTMKANGENLLRIDIESVGAFGFQDMKVLVDQKKIQFLEDPVGVYNEEYGKRIDRLIASAEKYDIYLNLVLTAHTCEITLKSAEKFSLYPYSVQRGGPLNSFDEFTTNAKAKELYLKRMEYVSKRWGSSDRIAFWEIYNELLNCGGKDPVAAKAWVAEIGQALRNEDMKNYGKAHPVIVSTVDIVPKYDFFVQSPGTDFMATHLYKTEINDTGNPIPVALAVHDYVKQNLHSLNYADPYIENERTLSRIFPENIQQEMEHTTAWAFISSGAANAGATWVRMGGYGAFRTENVVGPTHRAMRPIIDSINFAEFDSRPIDVPSSNPEVIPMVISDGNTALGWLLHNNPTDYDIENIKLINSLRQNEITGRVAGLRLIGAWLDIARAEGYNTVVDSIYSKIAKTIALDLNIPENVVIEHVEKIFDNPGVLRALAAQKGQEAVEQAVFAAATQALNDLERLESQEKVLENAYRGHPKVTTTLTLKGFSSGTHHVTWWNDNTGELIKKETVSGSTLILTTPPFSKHIAFTITE